MAAARDTVVFRAMVAYWEWRGGWLVETVRVDRRSALGLLGGLATAPLLTPCAAASQAPGLPDIPLAPIRRPEPGRVEIDLNACRADVMVGGRRAALWTYGGTFPGRLLRVREGETVRLRLANRLPEATNLHFHGLHVPPTGRADNAWLHIPPGETFVYQFQVPRGIAGTYWYHPHAHGRIARQLWAGLAGPLIVDGPLEAMPELAGADERIIVLKDLALDEGGRPAPHRVMDWHEGKQGDLILVNGAIQPQLQARAGMLRLRLINASNARYFRLALSGDQPLYLIATDGHYLDKPVAVAEVLLVPGERADVLMRVDPGRPLALRDLFYDRRTTHHSSERTLLTIVPAARALPLPLPQQLFTVPALEPADAVTRRHITMDLPDESLIDMVRFLPAYFQGLRMLDVPPPIVLLVSYQGIVGGTKLGVFDSDDRLDTVEPFPLADPLLLPEVIVDDDGSPEHYERELKPIFDVLWNAAGFARCTYYDADGNWRPPN